jgi:dolichol kinase
MSIIFLYLFIIPGIIFFVNTFPIIFYFIYFPTNLAAISHNVPAVCDGLAARIGKTVGFAGPTNCAGAMAWE